MFNRLAVARGSSFDNTHRNSVNTLVVLGIYDR
jgi:hypothetical protein